MCRNETNEICLQIFAMHHAECVWKYMIYNLYIKWCNGNVNAGPGRAYWIGNGRFAARPKWMDNRIGCCCRKDTEPNIPNVVLAAAGRAIQNNGRRHPNRWCTSFSSVLWPSRDIYWALRSSHAILSYGHWTNRYLFDFVVRTAALLYVSAQIRFCCFCLLVIWAAIFVFFRLERIKWIANIRCSRFWSESNLDMTNCP